MKYSPYSFSKMERFYICPFKFKLIYIDKLKPVKKFSIALVKGEMIHSIIEHIIKNKIKEYKKPSCSDEFTEDMRKKIFQSVFLFCKSDLFKSYLEIERNKFSEVKFFLDENLNIGKTKEGALFTGKIDYVCINGNKASVVDWKTGGKSISMVDRFPKDVEQLKIYSIWLFEKYKQVEEICADFCYIDLEYKQSYTFTRKELQDLKNELMNKIQIIESCDDFCMKKSKLCSYCDFENLCKDRFGDE